MFLFFCFFVCLNFSRCSRNSILAVPHFFLPVRKWTTVSLLPTMVSSTELLMCFCMRYSRMPDAGCCYCCCYYYCYCWHADLLTQFVSVPVTIVFLCSRCTIQQLIIWPQDTPLTPNDPYRGRTAPLTSTRCILYIYSKNIGTEYFKHGIYSPFFPPSKCSLFHNSKVFGSCIIHILYTVCAKIKKIIPAPKRYTSSAL